MDINQYIALQQNRIVQTLDALLPQDEKNTLYKAMRYAVLGNGKRFRPLLTYATAESLGASLNPIIDNAAASVELIHSYSLIHDDLPAMDDDDLRHGKPSCHMAFGEAIAILTGDALLSMAFEILSKPVETELNSTNQLRLVHELAKASGPHGMVLGQALDIFPEEIISIATLEEMHFHKTGALIQASIVMGAYAANCDDENIMNNLQAFSQYIGLAYQIQDDILDLESSTEHLGKPAKSDLKNDKQTYPILAGIENAKTQANELYDRAFSHLSKIGLESSILAQLMQYFVSRSN